MGDSNINGVWCGAVAPASGMHGESSGWRPCRQLKIIIVDGRRRGGLCWRWRWRRRSLPLSGSRLGRRALCLGGSSGACGSGRKLLSGGLGRCRGCYITTALCRGCGFRNWFRTCCSLGPLCGWHWPLLDRRRRRRAGRGNRDGGRALRDRAEGVRRRCRFRRRRRRRRGRR